MTKYGQIFILSQRHSRCFPFLLNHLNYCNKNISVILAQRICTITENQQQKLRHLSLLKENLKKYDYSVNIMTNVIKKALEIPQNELRKPKTRNKLLKFYHLFLHLIQITQLYKTELRIPLKSLREIFQDFKTSNLLTVCYNHLTLRNCWLKQNLTVKKQVLENAKICNANVVSHCYYPKNIHLKM